MRRFPIALLAAPALVLFLSSPAPACKSRRPNIPSSANPAEPGNYEAPSADEPMPLRDPLPLVMASSGAGSVLLGTALLFIGKRRKRP